MPQLEKSFSFFSVLTIFCAAIIFVFSSEAQADEVQETKPLRFVFQKQKDPAQLQAAAEKVGDILGEKIGQKVLVQVPLDYSASVQALVSGNADVAYLSSLPFLLARRDGGASILLAEERADAQGVFRTEYDSVFVVRKDSPIIDLDFLKKHAKDLRIVFTSPTSTSGYLFAYLKLVEIQLLGAKQDPKEAFRSVRFGGGYTQALEEVLAERADICAVSYYTVEGSGAEQYLPEEKRNQLRVLARTPGVPTHIIAVRGGLDEALKAQIKNALLALSKDHPTLLSDVYGAARFVEVDEDSHVKRTVSAVEALGLPIEGLQ